MPTVNVCYVSERNRTSLEIRIVTKVVKSNNFNSNSVRPTASTVGTTSNISTNCHNTLLPLPTYTSAKFLKSVNLLRALGTGLPCLEGAMSEPTIASEGPHEMKSPLVLSR
jgi:hypothetical protein